MATVSKSEKVDVSIIIVNFNGKSFLGPCLLSLQQQSFSHGVEIIVVDNASTDGSVEFLSKNHPEVTVIPQTTNGGFGQANNKASAVAKGEYLVFLNSDTQVEPDWLLELVSAARANPKIAAVTPRVYLFSSKVNSAKVQNAGILIFKQGYVRDRGILTRNGADDYEEDSVFFEQPTIVPACCGVSMLVTRSAFKEVGGFDPDYFMYYEDVDLSLRLRLNGYHCAYAPKAIVWHHHGASSHIASPFFIFQTERSRLLFIAKHFPLFTVANALFRYLEFIAVACLRAFNLMIRADQSSMNRWSEIARLRFSVLWQVMVKLPKILVVTRTRSTWQTSMKLYETFR